jgi:uncharacterized protein YdaU (DUF1376 family)
MGENESSRPGVSSTEAALTSSTCKGGKMAPADFDSTTGKAPAFQFYPADFLSDRNVVVMSMQERGVYITLICHAWQSPLPSDIAHLARICGTPLAAFRKLWPSLAVCFRPHPDDPGVLIHPRLERERLKQVEFRQRQSDRGKASGAARRKPHKPDMNAGSIPVQPDLNAGSTGSQPKPVELLSSSSLVSSSLVSSQTPSLAVVPGTRSKRPIFTGQRLVVFEWMLDDLARMLGAHTHAFDLHSWFFTLDQQAVDAGTLVPQRDGGRWLQERTLEEAARRGLIPAAEHKSKLTQALEKASRW